MEVHCTVEPQPFPALPPIAGQHSRANYRRGPGVPPLCRDTTLFMQYRDTTLLYSNTGHWTIHAAQRYNTLDTLDYTCSADTLHSTTTEQRDHTLSDRSSKGQSIRPILQRYF